ncbi:MAG TPA: tetratricopeptide repeat protein [Tepidisphaeraceae bacterium]|jgi:predicted O-linked N-acetylglucosamine transferase (SPINDLY family)
MTPPTVHPIYEQAVRNHRAGQLAQAESLYRQVLESAPGHADAMHMLGILAHQAGNSPDAVELLGRAVEINPHNADYHCNFAIALARKGEIDRAIDELEIAIRLKPGAAQAHNNLANLLRRRGQTDQAIEHYHKALDIRPNYASALANLGNAQMDGGQVDEAIASFRKAESLGNAAAAGSLLYALHFHPQSTPRSLRDEHVRWNRIYALPLAPKRNEYTNNTDPDRPLRVGYVSPDFRLHPVGRFLLPLFEHHDRERFKIYCYSDVHRPDAITERLSRDAHGWRETCAIGDEQLAIAVRQDQIDILVDLTMHMAGNRLGVFARKPAPLQVTYLAYCSTTGLTAMDYRLTDPYLDPPPGNGGAFLRDDSVYSEKSVRLPGCYWCYAPWQESPEVTPPPMLKSGRVTFGCLNNFCKVTRPTLEAWRLLMHDVPDSRLIIHAHEGLHRQRVREFFAGGQIDPSRIEFVSSAPLLEYLRIYQRIDIALDPFPYGGGTTTCDALWMGVVVVSLAGEIAVSRGGLSILSQLGLERWVGNDPESYVRIAGTLARDVDQLTQLRASLRDTMRRSSLMDAEGFVRGVEAAFRQMWRARVS